MSDATPSSDVRLIQGAVRFWRTRKWLVLAGLTLALALVYLASGVYTVPTNQTAALFFFGDLVRDDITAGIHFRLPAPIHRVKMINTTEVRRMTLKGKIKRTVSMITGDENLIEADVAVQYQIANLGRFLIGTQDWEFVIGQLIAAVLGEQMAKMPVDEILTTGKGEIQVALRVDMQKTLDRYDAGLTMLSTRIVSFNPPNEAAASFRKVADAKSDKAKRITEAQSKSNRRLSKSRGAAARITQDAKAFADERVKQAQGAAKRYLAILAEYRQARQVTRTTLYLKEMEKVLGRARIVLLDPRFPLDLNLFSRGARTLDDAEGSSQK